MCHGVPGSSGVCKPHGHAPSVDCSKPRVSQRGRVTVTRQRHLRCGRAVVLPPDDLALRLSCCGEPLQQRNAMLDALTHTAWLKHLWLHNLRCLWFLAHRKNDSFSACISAFRD